MFLKTDASDLTLSFHPSEIQLSEKTQPTHKKIFRNFPEDVMSPRGRILTTDYIHIF